MSLPVFWEKFKGVIIGLILTLILFRLHPNFGSSIRVIQDIPTFTTCIFGFMLTLLGIIIQGNGNVIVKMKRLEEIIASQIHCLCNEGKGESCRIHQL